MTNWATWVVIILFATLFGYGIISDNRLEKLELKYQELLLNKDQTIEQLQIKNELSIQTINTLEEKIYKLEHTTDSLKNIKIDISEREFEIASSISESVQLLRENLKCVDL